MMTQDSSKTNQHNHILKFTLARNVINIIKKMAKIDLKSLLKMATTDNKNALENQVKRLRKIKNQQKIQQHVDIDNEYILLAVVNYMKAISDVNQITPEHRSRSISILDKSLVSEHQETRQSIIIRRFQNALAEVQKNDSQLRKFMHQQVVDRDEIDYANCYDFFMDQFNKFKKGQGEKLFSQRMYTFEIILYFLTKIIKSSSQQNNQNIDEYEFHQYETEENENYIQSSRYQSFNYGLINKWKNLSSNSLYHKLIELSSICQQIPQLEAFNRTLQFAQLQAEQRTIFFKIVDVIISLHHRIRFLSRSQPEVVKQCDQLLKQINTTNSRCQNFLYIFQEEEGQQLLPISFSKSDSKSKGYFNQSLKDLKSHLTRMSEIIVSQDLCHTVNFNKLNGMLQLVDLYMKVLSGDIQILNQWNRIIDNLNQSKQKKQISLEEYKLIVMLQQCLEIQNSKIESIHNNMQPKSSAKTNRQLQDQINKLIEDYERLKNQNRKITQNLNHYLRANEQLEYEMHERDSMIQNLSMVKITLEKKIASKDDVQHRSKKQEHETQKYLESSLLLKQQLRISEAERQRVSLLLQVERQKNMKQYESSNKLRGQKQRLQTQLQELKEKIDNIKVQNLRHQSRLSKNINDMGNQKHLLQVQLQTADINNARLIQRLQANQKKLSQYSRLVMARFEERPQRKNDSETKIVDQLQQKLDAKQRQLQKLKRQITSLKRQQQRIYIQQDNFIKQNHWLKQQNQELKYKIQASQPYSSNNSQSNQNKQAEQQRNKTLNQELQQMRKQNVRMHKRIQELLEERRQFEVKFRSQMTVKENNDKNDLLMKQKELENYKSKVLEQERAILNNQNLFKRELNYANDSIKRQCQEIMIKDSIQSQLRSKLSKLQAELLKQKQQTTDTVEKHHVLQLNQHQNTIQKQKLIELKLRQQAKAMERELSQKIQVQIKLNIEIEKLSKQIQRMKNELNRFLKELTENELIIRAQQEKNNAHLRAIRQLQAKESVWMQNQESYHISPATHNNNRNTPLKDQPSNKHTKARDSSIVSKRHKQIDDSQQNSERQHSGYKSNVKYDIYFNLKEYQRLYKQYNDYKLLVASKMQSTQNIQNTINQLNYAKRSLEEHVHVLQQQKSKLEQDLHNQQTQLKQIPNLRQKIRQLTEKNNELMKILNSEGDETMKLKRQIESLKQSLFRLEAICNSNKTQKISFQQNLKHIREENRILSNYNQKLKSVVAQFQFKINDLSSRKQQRHFNQQYTQKNNQLLRQIRTFEDRIKQKIQKNDLLQRQNDQLRQQRGIIQDKFKQQVSINDLLQRQRNQLPQQKGLFQDKFKQQIQRNDLLQRQNSQLLKQRGLLQEKIENSCMNANINLNYYLQKIKYLQEALEAVGDELNDSKQALRHHISHPKAMQLTFGFNNKQYQKEQHQSDRYMTQNLNLRHEIQHYKSLQIQWSHKERFYINELQKMTQESLLLKDSISRNNNNKLITTTLNRQANYNKNTYQNIQRKLSFQGSNSGKGKGGNQNFENVYQYVQLQNVVEFVYRILIFFSQINYNSSEGSNIRHQLQKMANNSSGGVFFTTLQEYTKHILENNAIEQYKRELRNKAQELLSIKQKLDELITRQIEQEEKMLRQQPPQRSRQTINYVEYHDVRQSTFKK